MQRLSPITILMIALAPGCAVYEQETERAIELEEPRSSGGIILRDSPSEWAERWSRTLAERERQKAHAETTPSIPEVSEPPRSPPTSNWPSGTGKIIDLPKLNRIELRELESVVTRRLQAEQRYVEASRELLERIPALPDVVTQERVLAREDEAETRVLRFGFWTYRSRPPQVIAHAAILKQGTLEPNPDLTALELALQSALNALQETREGFGPLDLENEIIQLSYIDVKGAMQALKGLGLSTFESGTDIPPDLSFDQLPLVVELPAPKVEATGLVGGSEQPEGKFGSTIVPTLASDMKSEMIASPTSRILVLYHPAHPEQFSRVQNFLRDVVDRPARQIFVEAMILEISSAGLKELGVQWSSKRESST